MGEFRLDQRRLPRVGACVVIIHDQKHIRQFDRSVGVIKSHPRRSVAEDARHVEAATVRSEQRLPGVSDARRRVHDDLRHSIDVAEPRRS